MALTADRNTAHRAGEDFVFPVATATKIYAGALVMLNASGYATKGAAATGQVAVGRAEEQVDNTGADGALSIKVRRGVFRWANSAAGDAITKAEIGDAAYIVDDQTVAKTDGTGTRSPAGIIADVDGQGVWVATDVEILNSPATALLAANNLSDVGTAATAFSNIKQAATTAATGVGELATSAETLTGTDAARLVTPKGAADTYAAKFGAPVFAVGGEAGNAINVTIQLKDAALADLAVRGSVFGYLSDDANGDALAATAPSGNVVIGTDGLMIDDVAKKSFRLVSEADGDIDVTINEAGAATWYLILVLPDGRLAASGAITFA